MLLGCNAAAAAINNNAINQSGLIRSFQRWSYISCRRVILEAVEVGGEEVIFISSVLLLLFCSFALVPRVRSCFFVVILTKSEGHTSIDAVPIPYWANGRFCIIVHEQLTKSTIFRAECHASDVLSTGLSCH